MLLCSFLLVKVKMTSEQRNNRDEVYRNGPSTVARLLGMGAAAKVIWTWAWLKPGRKLWPLFINLGCCASPLDGLYVQHPTSHCCGSD